MIGPSEVVVVSIVGLAEEYEGLLRDSPRRGGAD
jgi:hypothetical protein